MNVRKFSRSSDHHMKTEMMVYLKRSISVDEDVPDIYEKQYKWITTTDLFNLLNQEDSQGISKLRDKNYLLLLDTRSQEEYNVGHILTAKHIKKNALNKFKLPFGSDIECKSYLVTYDTYTDHENTTDPAVMCAMSLLKSGARQPVGILKGGYAEFCKCYPDYRTTQILFTPQELDYLPTYPNEIIKKMFFLGSTKHAESYLIHQELKIKAHINCTTMNDRFFMDFSSVYQISTDEYDTIDLMHIFPDVCAFIEYNLSYNQPVLTYSDRGISISATIAIAFLIKYLSYSLQMAYEFVRNCRGNINPTLHFLNQLSEWEKICLPDSPPTNDVEALPFVRNPV